jgi:2-haloacid dehalogenase
MTFILEGADELCRELSEKYEVYIVTNGIKDVQMGRLGGSRLSGSYIKAFVSEEMGCEKPRVEYFEAVAKCIPGFEKSKAVIIGDSLSSDMKGGINFGIDTCWFNPSGKPVPDGMRLTYVVSSFDGIREIFLK